MGRRMGRMVLTTQEAAGKGHVTIAAVGPSRKSICLDQTAVDDDAGLLPLRRPLLNPVVDVPPCFGRNVTLESPFSHPVTQLPVAVVSREARSDLYTADGTH